MNTRTAPFPENWHTVTPRIVVHESKRFVEFLIRTLDGRGMYEEERPSIIWIGDSALMISEAGPRNPMPAFLYVYVVDVDATFERVLEAKVRVVEPPGDTPYGDRRCMFEDAWGNTWQIATYSAR